VCTATGAPPAAAHKGTAHRACLDRWGLFCCFGDNHNQGVRCPAPMGGRLPTSNAGVRYMLSGGGQGRRRPLTVPGEYV
jgi:hypothetical protein